MLVRHPSSADSRIFWTSSLRTWPLLVRTILKTNLLPYSHVPTVEAVGDGDVATLVQTVVQSVDEVVEAAAETAATLPVVGEGPLLDAITATIDAATDAVETAVTPVIGGGDEGGLPNEPNPELPSGGGTGALGAACDQLINLVSEAVDSGVDGAEVPPEFETIFESIECGCELENGGLAVGCKLDTELCEFGVCGKPNFRGYYRLGGLFSDALLHSRACFVFGDETDDNTSDLCIEADHGGDIANIDTIDDCRAFAWRNDGTQEECSSCEVCGASGQAIRFDCSNVDLDERDAETLFLPATNECVGSGLVAIDSLSDPDFTYIPLGIPFRGDKYQI